MSVNGDCHLFNNNPYADTLRTIHAWLAGPQSLADRPRTDVLFAFSDPIDAVTQLGPAAIPDRVCVVGGGIAGLTAAYEFLRIAERFGKPSKICIFERTARLGGRILTHHFNGRAYAELGPMRLPAYHKIALHYVDLFGLRLHTFPSNATYHFSKTCQTEGRVDSARAGRSIGEAYTRIVADRGPRLDYFFPMEGVELPAVDGMEDSFSTTFQSLAGFANSLYRREIQTLDLYANRPSSDWGKLVEGMTVRAAFMLFMKHRASGIPGVSHQNITECAEFLWETLGRANGWIWLEHISMAHFLRETAGFAGAGAKYAIAGGFGRLVDAFVGQLNAAPRVSIRLRHGVVGIDVLDSGTRVHTTSPLGPIESEEFDAVICAAPASAVAHIRFTPPLQPDKQNALSSISYLAASKSAALFANRFWELDGQQLGGATFTDLENQQIWYPNDNITYDDDDGPEVPKEGAPARHTERLRTPRELKDLEISGQPGSLIAAYMWGENARRFASLANSQRDDLIIRCLETVYPGCSRELLDLVHWPWDAQTNPGGGAFAWYQPGQQSRYQEPATRPHPGPARGVARVYFAGEHLGLIQGWIQAAMATALYAVKRACGARS